MTKRLSHEHIGLVVALVVVVIFAWWIGPHHELMAHWIERAGWWGPLIAVGLYVLLSLTPIPSDPLTIVAVVLYGPFMGLLISWMGNNAAAMVEYFISQRVERWFRIEYQTLPTWLKRFPVQSPWFLIGVRFVPAIGGKMVAIMAGMYGVRWWRFVWTTAIANLAGSIIWVLGGVGLIRAL